MLLPESIDSYIHPEKNYICPESEYIDVVSYTHPEDADNSIGIVLQEQLYNGVGSTLMDQWMYDISQDRGIGNQYSVTIVDANFPGPEELRSWLLEWHGSSDDPLLGIILVGDIPYAECKWTNTDIDLLTMGSKEIDIFPSDFYFMDLNGEWLDTNQDGYYDSWPEFGWKYFPEIFCGRFPFSTIYNTNYNIEALRAYLIRNHEWRYNGCGRTRNLLFVDDLWAFHSPCHNSHLNAMLDWSDLNLLHYYYPLEITCHSNWISCIGLGGNFLWATVFVHGPSNFPRHNWKPSGAGTTYPEDVAGADVLFYNLWHCYGGNHLFYNRSMAEAYLYTSDCLALIASSKSGAMDYARDFYDDMSNGHHIGHAFKDWFISSIDHWEVMNNQQDLITWIMGLHIFGDPTLRPNIFQ